jgi:hypothetical protein
MKNPWLSMWLSSANTVAGSARGRATAAIKRETQAAVNRNMQEGMKQAMQFWSGAWLLPAATAPAPAPKKRKRR